MFIRLRYLIFLVVLVFGLGYIYIQHDYNGLYYRPNDPPTLSKKVFTNKAPSLDEVLEYQEDIINYIKYLEEHYIAVGVYFGGKQDFPILLHRNDECRIYDYIFKDIALPSTPSSDLAEKDLDTFISLLVEHVQELRSKIKENNRNNEQLRHYYKNCFKHQLE